MSDKISEKILLIVGEIKGEVKGIKEQLIRQNGILANHEGRINKNETARDRQKGISAAIAFVISAIGIAITWFKFKK